jgi:hypothetical protein
MTFRVLGTNGGETSPSLPAPGNAWRGDPFSPHPSPHLPRFRKCDFSIGFSLGMRCGTTAQSLAPCRNLGPSRH